MLVLLSLLIILNLSAVLIYNAYQSYEMVWGYLTGKNSPIPEKALLPNYQNIDWAEQHFIEYENVEHEYKSFVGWRALSYKGETINIDERGIRNTPQTDSVAENVPTVVFLGGSAMWGVGVNDENTIPAHFVDVTNSRYRAVNLGEIAYNAFQSFIFLKLQILDGLKPNIIITYDGVNEAPKYRKEIGVRTHSRDIQIRNSLKGIDKRITEPLRLENYFLGPIKSLINKTIGKFNLRNGVIRNQELKSNYDHSSERTYRIAKELLDSWLSIKELAEQNNAIFIAVLQPNIATGNPKLDHIEIESNPDYYEVELTKVLYPRIIDLMDHPEYRELKNNFLDLSNAFDIDEYIYIDECHVSPNGNRIIAEKISNHIDFLIKNNSEE